MTQRISTLIVFLLVSFQSFSQYLDSDITIITEGLSEEYAAKFKGNRSKSALLNALSERNVPTSIFPMKIIVTYENDAGDIMAEINYDQDKIFANSDYGSLNQQWSYRAKGISVYLQHQIFSALSQYLKSVAINEDYVIDKDILDFESTVKCQKENGDFVNFYAHNYIANGYFSYSFYINAHIMIEDKIYETQTTNSKTLNDMKFFSVGKTTGLDGSITGAYYFCKFFNVNLD